LKYIDISPSPDDLTVMFLSTDNDTSVRATEISWTN